MQVGRQGQTGRPATATVDRAGRDRTTWGKLVADGGNDDGIKDMDTLTRSRGKEGGREGQSQRGKQAGRQP